MLKLIIRGNVFTWTGSWEVTGPLNAGTPSARQHSDRYSHLVCLEASTYLLLDEDRPGIDDMLGASHTHAVNLSIGVIDSERQVYRVTGHGLFADQRKLEETLRESEERFRLMANTVPQILWITDGEGRVEFFNRQWAAYTGFPPPATAGEVATMFLHPDDSRATIEAFTHALETQTAFRVEHRIKSADGSYRWFVVRAEPYVDPVSGHVTRWFGASVDIDDRKLAERQLEEFNQQLERQVEERTRFLKDQAHFITSVVETMPDMLSVRALETGAIEYINHAPFTANGFDGATLQAMTPARRRSLIHPDDLQAVAEYFEGFYSLGDDDLCHVEYRSKNNAGEWLWFNARGKVFKRNVGGRATHAVSVVQNITAMKASEIARIRSQEELLQANEVLLQQNRTLQILNQELEIFAFIASHDLREPLRKIQLFASQLLEQEGDKLSPKASALCGKIITSAIRMNSLIAEILTFSIVHADSTKEKTNVDLNDVLRTVLDELRELIEDKNVVVAYPALPTIEGHSLQLVQLFQNLLSNSIKFQKQDGIPSIEITSDYIPGTEVPGEAAAGEATYVRIGIRDNGIGFEQTYAEKIFGMFQRLNDVQAYSGTGMGLAICRKVMQNHDGFITAHGAVGAGSSFFCFFPLKR